MHNPELICYVFVYLVSITLIRSGQTEQRDNCFFDFIFVLVGITQSLVVRSGPLEADIAKYAAANPSLSDYYYLREFLFWAPWAALKELTPDMSWLLIGIDALVIVMLLAAVRKSRINYGVAISIFFFFAFMAGQQNILRQHLATIVLFYLIYAQPNSTGLPAKAALSLVATLIHNVAAVLASSQLRLAATTAGSLALGCVAFIAFSFFSEFKSASSTGGDWRVPMILVLVLISLLFSLTRSRFKHLKPLVAIGIAAALSLESAQAERVCFAVLLLLYPAIFYELQKFRIRRVLVFAALSSSFILTAAGPLRHFLHN